MASSSHSSNAPQPNVYSFIPSYIREEILTYYEKELQGPQQELSNIFQQTIPHSDVVQHVNAQRHSRSYSIGEISISKELGVPSQDHKAILKGMAATPLLVEAPMEIWDASEKNKLQLVISTSTGKVGGDVQAKTCFANLKKIDSFFRSEFSIYPVNSATKLMRCYIHVPDECAFNNAFWHPETESVYFGNTDPRFFKPFVNNLEITAHEFGHAITHYSSDLIYLGQSGALNESISDVFGMMVKHHNMGVSANSPDANWLIGEGLLVNPTGKGTALRSMIDPGSAYQHPILKNDPQPNHMDDYRILPETREGDWGGVHINSGIPNRAFSLAAIQLQGPIWDRVGKIWHHSLINSRSDADFSTFAIQTLNSTKQLRYSESVYQCIAKGWMDVGVDLRGLGHVSITEKSNQGFPWTGILLSGGAIASIIAIGFLPNSKK